MKHDIHEINNELYTKNKQSQIDKQRRENTKKLKYNSLLILKEEIENYICDLGVDYDIHDLQLKILDNQDIIIDNASEIIIHKDYCDDNKEQIRLYLKDKFLSQFNVYFREYKTRHNIEKQIEKQHKKNMRDDMIDKLSEDFDKVNNTQRYDMNIVLKNMNSEGYIRDVFNYLDLDYNNDNIEVYHKALNEVKRRKKDTIKDVIIGKQKKIPVSWKCYGILKMIDKMIK